MGFRFRKSIKIAPGIKLNLSKSGLGMSMGTKGARVSVNSNGNVTRTISILGTGISHVTTDFLKNFKKKEKKAKEVVALSGSTSSYSQNLGRNNVIEESTNLSGGSNLPPKKSKRWLIYVAITLIATMINPRLFYPAILIQSMYHLVRINMNKGLYDYPKRKKYILFSAGLILFSTIGLFTSTFATPSIPVETIVLSVKNNTMDINENQYVQLHYTPENADISKIRFEVSDDSLAEISKLEDGELELKTFSNEGDLSILAETSDVKSDALILTIIDKEKQKAERIAAEKKAEEERIAAEKKVEEEKLAAEKKAEEERIAAEKKAEEERIAAEQKTANASVSATNTQKSNSRTVYVTPTGKKYHYSGSCNGGHYSESTLDEALSMGLTPCKKCVY